MIYQCLHEGQAVVAVCNMYILAHPRQPLPATRARRRPAPAAGGRTPQKPKEYQ